MFIDLELNANIAEVQGGILSKSSGEDNDEVNAITGYNITIDNCSVTLYDNYSIGEGAGGIVGNYAGYNGNCNVTNCYTTGKISGEDAGGICGEWAG